MSHYHNNQIPSASDSHSTKPELSGLKHRKIIPGDYESAWSPTSPLDFRMLSTFANPFGGRSSPPPSSSSPRPIRKRQQKSWDSEKVGLSIVDSLDDSSRILLPSTDSKNIIFGSSLMRSGNPKCPKPHHLPNPILEHFPFLSNPFAKTPIHKEVELGGVNNNACQVMKPTESEIEMSEDYTCVISHGPNPKTTHFYGDHQVLVESVEVNKDCCNGKKKVSIFEIAPLPLTTPDELLPPPNDFLSSCCFCSKKLVLSKDIYMYRGYKAFCSSECRLEEILMDEEMMEEDEDEDEAESSEKKSNGVFFTLG